MFGSTGEWDWDVLLHRLSSVVDDLQAAGLATQSGQAELDVLPALETQKNRIPTVEHRLIADVQARGTAGEHGCAGTAVLLGQLLRITPREAGARVQAAAELGPRRGLTGQPLPPRYGPLAAAQAAGQISPAHALVITKTIYGLPDAIQAEHEDWLADSLLAQAHTVNPVQLAQVAAALAYLLDQDGTLAEDQERARRRELRIRRRPDGSARIDGELTAICAEALLSTLEPLAKPAPAEDGAQDPRTSGQRLHDALQDATLMVLRSEQLPDCAGVAATIVLHLTPEQVQTGTGLVATGHGAQISVDQASTLFGDARIFPVVLGAAGEILGYGPSSRRVFTEGQRLAMTARDKGCSFPGCTHAPTRCHSHHITDYALTRRTSVDDGTLLCGLHHREHAKLGWTCRMINGIPHWTAPRWLDPHQTPRRNRAHPPVLV